MVLLVQSLLHLSTDYILIPSELVTIVVAVRDRKFIGLNVRMRQLRQRPKEKEV